MAPQYFRLYIELPGKRRIRFLDIAGLRQDPPHVRPGRIQPKILLRVQVKQHGFPIQIPHQDLGRNYYAIRKHHLERPRLLASLLSIVGLVSAQYLTGISRLRHARSLITR